jgi:8-hydroxy-5-deazaflavin:NADPH oxidoreductase
MNELKLAILGGTGQEGSALAARFARAGYTVTLGSRDAAKARSVAASINETTNTSNVHGADNLNAAAGADLAILTVPFASQQTTVAGVRDALKGKILVDATVPLMPPKVSVVQLPNGGSAVAALQAMVGTDIRVVSAFQNVSHAHLKDLDHEIDCDVLVCADDAKAAEQVIELVKAIGMRGFYGGPIQNSIAAEALTSVLIAMNRKYKSPGAGIRFTAV